MLRNYLTIALRNLRRNWGYTAINLIGLAVGLAACILIGLYVRHELSYDDFQKNGDRIYRDYDPDWSLVQIGAPGEGVVPITFRRHRADSTTAKKE